jgi:hypothetical protein
MTASTGRQAKDPAVGERITVALTPKGAAELLRAQERNGLSKTDVVNRAIGLYEFVDSEASAGSDLMIRTREGEKMLIKLI